MHVQENVRDIFGDGSWKLCVECETDMTNVWAELASVENGQLGGRPLESRNQKPRTYKNIVLSKLAAAENCKLGGRPPGTKEQKPRQPRSKERGGGKRPSSGAPNP